MIIKLTETEVSLILLKHINDILVASPQRLDTAKFVVSYGAFGGVELSMKEKPVSGTSDDDIPF